jgi:hypothetical protein
MSQEKLLVNSFIRFFYSVLFRLVTSHEESTPQAAARSMTRCFFEMDAADQIGIGGRQARHAGRSASDAR